MEDVGIVVLMVLIAVGMLSLWARGSHADKVKHALHHGKKVTIAKFPDRGDGRVDGELVYAAESLSAPFSGRKCAYYYAVVKGHRGSAELVSIARESKARDFVLRDETGQALVRMQGAKVAVHKDEHIKAGLLSEVTPELEAFLSRHGQSSKGWVLTKRLQFEEGVLEEGEMVAVRGYGSWEHDPNPDPEAYGSYRDQPKQLQLSKPAGGEMYVSDDPDIVEPRSVT